MSSRQEKTTTEALEPAPQAENNIVNGVNVTAPFQTVEAVKVNPVIAKFRFTVKNEWLDGAHNRSVINGFPGAMQDIERSQSFVLDADEHPILLGRDRGPNAGEYLLQALAACVTSTLIYHAAAEGLLSKRWSRRSKATSTCGGSSGPTRACATDFRTSVTGARDQD